MFEDTKNELKALEGQMLAAEQSRDTDMLDDNFEALFNEIKANADPRNDEPPIRNYANGYGKYSAPVTYTAPVYAPAPAPMHEPAPEPRKKRHGGLGLIIFLEIVALIAVLGFWALYLLG